MDFWQKEKKKGKTKRKIKRLVHILNGLKRKENWKKNALSFPWLALYNSNKIIFFFKDNFRIHAGVQQFSQLRPLLSSYMQNLFFFCFFHEFLHLPKCYIINIFKRLFWKQKNILPIFVRNIHCINNYC